MCEIRRGLCGIGKEPMNRYHSRCLKKIATLFAIVLLAGNAGLSAGGKDPLNQGRLTEYFKIQVVDSATGRGVPLVELRTVNNIRYYTDSNGIVAFYEPGLMNQEVFFFVESHGYEFPKDGFGFRGTKLKTLPGGSAVLKIDRVNIAERLYRVTGQGIYGDSLLTGHSAPLKNPVLNGLVLGQDSVYTCLYHGRLFWLWGDTSRASYPLGHFAMAGAFSDLPEQKGLDPNVGVDLDYFVDEMGFSRPISPFKEPGMIWLDGLIKVSANQGAERMVAKYARMKDLGDCKERGLVVFNDETNLFEPLVRSRPDFLPYPDSGHGFAVDVEGEKYYYFGTQFPLAVRMRVRALWDDVIDPNRYEVLTSLEASDDRPKQTNGACRWLRADALGGCGRTGSMTAIIGALKREKAKTQLYDIKSGKSITPHGGSVYYNAHHRRWIMIFVQHFGDSSMLGEVWYAEADTPVGQWAYARKIATHNKYSFYNPKQHPYFDQAGGRIIYFEGTYSHTFSGSPETATPRYDYNQIMYRLDLDDPRLTLPVAVYKLRDNEDGNEYLLRDAVEKAGKWDSVEAIPFFAVEPERANDMLVGVYAQTAPAKTGGTISLSLSPSDSSARPLFYALPPAHEPDENSSTVLLYEYRHTDTGQRLYSTDTELASKDWIRGPNPLCCVWKTPQGPILIDGNAKPSDPQR
ncbi:MAG: hypothetical protein JXN61_04280 [Sedimentisphaerales bacterium]|nr:hypothetical protein [Sedimentisphaerales bacterium]